ncbi:MAG: hypothetical protein HY481_01650, partial [Candidatus Vogelbacteria bacterium]|nr:hypothetical protein [Candidatus Vogelbacteria bacterium]
ALLYAVLLVSVVLTISLSLLNITFKQIVLSAVSRDSQIAHFNAWSAVDCVYSINREKRELNLTTGNVNDTFDNPFGVFNFDSGTLDLPTVTTFICGDEVGSRDKITATFVSAEEVVSNVVTRYKLSGPGLNDACTIVDMVKVFSGNYADFPGEGMGEDDAAAAMTTAYGYNSLHPCNDDTSSRLVERRIRKKL